MANVPATASSDPRQAADLALSPNSQDFMAMLQREFAIQVPSQGAAGQPGAPGNGAYAFSGTGFNTPPLDEGAQGYAFGGPAGMGGTIGAGAAGAGGKAPPGVFSLDQFLPFTNGTAPGLASLQQPSSLTGQVGLNALARGGARGALTSSSSAPMQAQGLTQGQAGAYPAYGVHTPEGSTDRAEGSASGAGSPEMRESPTTSTGPAPGRQGSASSGGRPRAPAKKNSGARGTIARELRPEDEGEVKTHAQGQAKRKAGSTEDVAMHEEDESEGSSDEDNEPSTSKRKATAGASRRKSTAASGANGSGPPEVSKAIKRKEQNRAAQKAFRERREQRVKDLEDKVRDLEEKSFGQSVENENLRQLLSKLQKENMTLQSGGFSFNGPMPTMSDLNAGNLEALQPIRSNSSGHSEPQMQSVKPPTPPVSVSESQRNQSSTSLASKDASPGGLNSGATPASTASKSTSDSSPANVSQYGGLFGGDPYGGFSGGVFSNTDAYPMGMGPPAPQPLQSPTRGAPQQPQFAKPMQPFSGSSGGPGFSLVNDNTTPFTVLSFNPANTSYRDNTPFGNMGGGLGFGNFDYRDPSAGGMTSFETMNSFPNGLFDNLNDDAMDELLNSLNAPAPPPAFQGGAAPSIAVAGGGSFSVTSDGTHVMSSATEHDKYLSPPTNAMDTSDDLLNAYFREAFPTGGASSTPQVQSQQMRQQSTATSASGQGGNMPFVSPSSNTGFSPSNYFTFSPEATASTAPTSQPGSTGRDSSSPGQSRAGGLLPGRTNPLAVGTIGPRDMCDSKRIVGKNGEFLTQQDMWEKLQQKLDMSDGLDLDDLCDHFKGCGVGGSDGPVVPEACLDKALDHYAEKKREARLSAAV